MGIVSIRGGRIAACTAFALSAFGLSLGATAEAAWTDTATHVLPVVSTLTSTGAAASNQPLHIAVGLAVQNRAELESFLTSIRTPGNPAYGAMLTPAQFASSYSPSVAQAQSVADYLAAAGFTHIVIAPNRLVISADGTAAMAESAFNTPIALFTLNGATVYSNTQTAQVPDSLDGLVTAVLGLQNINRRRASPVHPSLAPRVNNGAGTTQALDIKDFPIAYDAKYVPTAVTYAIFMYGDVRGVVTDLKTAETNNGLSHTTVNLILADGEQGTDTSGNDEWDLDSQSSRGIAGEVQQEIWYVSSDGSDASFIQTYNRWVTDDVAKGASASFGDCEVDAKSTGEETSNDPIFMEAAAQGQTLFSSSGDTGAGCSAFVPNGVPDGGTPQQSYPGISPYALEVGGTTLNTNADFTYGSETAWTESGGGLGLTEPEPAWQVGVVGSAATTSGNKASCDVSMAGDPNSGANVVVDGAVETVGGTSLSSPLVVGVWARLEAAYGNALGFAGPVLYGLEGKGVSAGSYGPSVTGFNDPASGFNGVYRAGAGWDYPTGVGTFDICMTANMLGKAGGTNFCLPQPVAALGVSSNTTLTSQALTFDGTASTASTTAAKVVSYIFDFGDGSAAVTSSTPTVSYTYANAGSYTATLHVKDSVGQTSINLAQQVIQVTAAPTYQAPTAGLSVSPASGSAPLPVTFNGASSTTPNSGATISSYTFNFGDGSASVTQSSSSVSHTYTAAGNYTASLTVTDSVGQTSTNAAQQAVSVTTPSGAALAPPTAALSASPVSGTSPLAVSFDGSASTTPNSGASITSYTFNFGDGSASVTQTSAQVSHTYSAAGSFVASLTVTDSAGQASSNSAQQTIDVSAPASPALVTPNAALSATPISGTAPLAVAFDGSASSTSNAGATITTYSFNFGDGSAVVTQGSATVSHNYTATGGYTATLTVTDSDGETSTNAAQQNIQVSATASPALAPPTAALSASPGSGMAPLAVTFSGSASTTPNAGASVTRYTFDFGDGSAAVTQSSATASHSYTTAGNYTASLTVTDSDGQTSTNSAQQTIQVSGGGSTALVTPIAALSASPNSGTAPLTVTLLGSASMTSNAGATITSYTFNFGDGSPAITQSSPTVSHIYTASGGYTATLTVTDSDGESSTNSAQQGITTVAAATSSEHRGTGGALGLDVLALLAGALKLRRYRRVHRRA